MRLAHGIGAQLRVGIDAYNVFGVGVPDAVVQCRCLSSVGLSEDYHLVVAVVSLMHALQRVVLASVVDEDDVERRIVFLQQRGDGAHAVDLLVVCRYYYRDAWRVSLCQRGIVAEPLGAFLLHHEEVHEGQAHEAQYEEDDEQCREEIAGMVYYLSQREVGLHGIVGLSLRYGRHEAWSRDMPKYCSRDMNL